MTTIKTPDVAGHRGAIAEGEFVGGFMANAEERLGKVSGIGLTGIVIVNFGSHGLLGANVPKGSAFGANFRIIVVDNFSTAAERRALVALVTENDWELVKLPHNEGFGAAVNAGVSRARQLGCASFIVLNPDAALTPDVAKQLRKHVAAHRADLVAPLIRDSSGDVVFQGSLVSLWTGRMLRDRSVSGDSHPVPSEIGVAHVATGPTRRWLTGACVAVHEELWLKVGGFDEAFFLYWEDVDLSLRAEDAGGRLVVRSDLSVVHDEGGTQGTQRGRAKSNAYYYYNSRNRMVFAARHLDRRGVFRWLLSTPRETWQILLRGGRRQMLHTPSVLLAAARGALVGVLLGARALIRPRTTSSSVAPARKRLLIAHPSAELYGSDRVLLESVEAFLRSRFEVVVTLPTSGPLVPELERRGAVVRFCRTPVLRKSALRPAGMFRLLSDGVRGAAPAIRLIRQAGTDGVFVNTVTIPFWLVIGRLMGRHVTCHVHEAERSAPAFVRRVMTAPVLCAHVVILNSRFSMRVLTDSIPRLARRSRVVYNGIPGPSVVVPARLELVGPVRLLFLGRLSPRKGPQVAIEACRQLSNAGVDVRLDLLGSVYPGYEWFEKELRYAVTSAALGDRVTFRGFVPDIWASVADCDVVLIPSTVDEPFGNTAVEAVLAARPLVVSTTSGLQEAAAGYESAQAVDPTRPDLWAAAVRSVIASWPEFRMTAIDDASTAEQRHAPRRYGEQIVELVTAMNRVSVK